MTLSNHTLVSGHQLLRDSLTNGQPRHVLHPQPLAVWVTFEEHRFTGLRDQDVEAAEVEPEGLQIGL